MKPMLKYLVLTALLAGALAGAPSLFAADSTTTVQDKTTPQTKETLAKDDKAKRDWYPFSGIVSSVNKQAFTITLKRKEGERVLRVDSKSLLEINGKPAVIGSVKEGDYAHGKLHKDRSGNEVIASAKFDKEPPKKKSEKKSEKPETGTKETGKAPTTTPKQ